MDDGGALLVVPSPLVQLLLGHLVKKTIAAVTAGLLLVAGQAAAANDSAAARVGDRIGATAGESSEFAGVPLPVLIVLGAILVTGVVAATDDSESD